SGSGYGPRRSRAPVCFAEGTPSAEANEKRRRGYAGCRGRPSALRPVHRLGGLAAVVRAELHGGKMVRGTREAKSPGSPDRPRRRCCCPGSIDTLWSDKLVRGTGGSTTSRAASICTC